MHKLIQNGRVIDPANNIDTVADLYIVDGVIAGIGNTPEGFNADRTIDATDQLVIPGLVDLAARLGEPGSNYAGNIASETQAAVHGGVTSVCCSPDMNPVIDSTAVIELIHNRMQASYACRILPLGALTYQLEGKALSEMATLKKAGCVAVSNGLRTMQNAEVMRRSFEYAKSCELSVLLFCEDTDLRNNGVVHEGAIGTRLGLPMTPVSAETVAISRAILLAEEAGCHLHICRVTSARAVELIAEAQQRDINVTADVSITHLHLNDLDTADYNTLCHLRPPLRSQSDREALIQGLKSGVITAVCSDHQPHTLDAKLAPFSQTEAGASTIEVLLPLMLNLVENQALDLNEAIALITHKPADIIGQTFGTLAKNASADICIIDPNKEWQVTPENLISEGKNCPFKQWHLQASVTHTLLEGHLVYKDRN